LARGRTLRRTRLAGHGYASRAARTLGETPVAGFKALVLGERGTSPQPITICACRSVRGPFPITYLLRLWLA
jgi:hypothetical protein